MARTREDITIGSSWTNLNEASGIGVGQSMAIQNKSYSSVIFIEDDEMPEPNDTRGDVFTTFERTSIMEGSLTIWARSVNDRPVRLSVQEG